MPRARSVTVEFARTFPKRIQAEDDGWLCLHPNALSAIGQFDSMGQLQAINSLGQARLDTLAGV